MTDREDTPSDAAGDGHEEGSDDPELDAPTDRAALTAGPPDDWEPDVSSRIGTVGADSPQPADQGASPDASSDAGESPTGAAETDSESSSLARVVPGIVRNNLQVKVLVGILAVILVTAAIAGFFYISIGGELDSQIDTQVEETTALHSDIYITWQSNRMEAVDTVAGDVGLDIPDQDHRNELLGDYAAENDGFVRFYLTDRESGEILASSSSHAVGGNVYDHFDADHVGERDAFVIPTRYRSLDRTHVIAFGTERPGDENQLVIGEYEAAAGPTFRQPFEGAETTIVNTEGELLFGSAGVDPAVLQADDQLDRDEDEDLTGEVQITNIERGDAIFSSANVGEDIYLVTTTPADEAFALRDEVLQSFLVTLLLLFGVLTVAGIAGSRSIVRSITQLNGRVAEMEAGNLDVDLETGRTDEIGELYAGFESMRTTLKERISEAEQARERAEEALAEGEQAREDAEAARERVEQMNEAIQATAAEYSDVMETAADGDLSVRMTPDENNEAMEAIAREFNQMLDEVEATIQDIKSFASEVETTSQEVTAASQEALRASEQVAEAIQEIAAGADEQNESLQSITQEMNDLSATVEEIASSSREVESLAEQTATRGMEGRDAAQEAIAGMKEVREDSTEAVTEIEALEEQVAYVDELIARITDIAEQTNMLALNANIEAARAGGDGGGGEGFAVVADEVKQLAEEVQETATEIEGRLEEIRTQTRESVDVVSATSEGVKEHTDSVENAAEALEEVADHAEETDSGISDISRATGEQADSTEQVVTMVDDVATIADEVASEAEDTAATAQEQTASMTEVSEQTSGLVEQAQQLAEALDRFETSQERHSSDADSEE